MITDINYLKGLSLIGKSLKKRYKMKDEQVSRITEQVSKMIQQEISKITRSGGGRW